MHSDFLHSVKPVTSHFFSMHSAIPHAGERQSSFDSQESISFKQLVSIGQFVSLSYLLKNALLPSEHSINGSS